MTRLLIFAPVAALAAFAGYLGLRAGRAATDTQIIDRYAAAYVSAVGDQARRTDCAATIHPDPTVRMVIACTHARGTVTHYFVGQDGQLLDPANLDGPAA